MDAYSASLDEKFGRKKWFMSAHADSRKPQYWEAFDTMEQALDAAKAWTNNDDARAVYGSPTTWRDAKVFYVVKFETVREVSVHYTQG